MHEQLPQPVVHRVSPDVTGNDRPIYSVSLRQSKPRDHTSDCRKRRPRHPRSDQGTALFSCGRCDRGRPAWPC